MLVWLPTETLYLCTCCSSFLERCSLSFSLMCLLLHIISQVKALLQKAFWSPRPIPGSPHSSRRAFYMCFSAHCSFRVLSALGGWTVCLLICVSSVSGTDQAFSKLLFHEWMLNFLVSIPPSPVWKSKKIFQWDKWLLKWFISTCKLFSFQLCILVTNF